MCAASMISRQTASSRRQSSRQDDIFTFSFAFLIGRFTPLKIHSHSVLNVDFSWIALNLERA